MAKALALGADAIAIGTAGLVALNCNKDIPEADYEKEMGVEAGFCITVILADAQLVLQLRTLSLEVD